jgi:hypothetical protein
MQARTKRAGHGNRRLAQAAGWPVTRYLHPTARRECLDWLIIRGQRHIERVLEE